MEQTQNEDVECIFCEQRYSTSEIITHIESQCIKKPKLIEVPTYDFQPNNIQAFEQQIETDIQSALLEYGKEPLQILLKYISNASNQPKHRKIRKGNDFFQKNIYNKESLLKVFLKLKWNLDLTGEFYEFINHSPENLLMLDQASRILTKHLQDDLKARDKQVQNHFHVSEAPILIELSDDEEVEEQNDLDQLELIRKKRKQDFLAKKPNANTKEQKHSGNFNVSANLKSQLNQIRHQKRKEFFANEGKQFMTLSDLSAQEKKRQETLSEWGSGKMSPEMIQIGKEALELTNQFRKSHNLPALKWHQSIADVGQIHSKNMAEGKVAFGHDGFQERIKQFPFPSRSAAENVAWCSHSLWQSARVSVDGWIHSPGHRKNLLSHHEYCGIGVYRNMEGKVYFTQLFANM